VGGPETRARDRAQERAREESNNEWVGQGREKKGFIITLPYPTYLREGGWQR